MFPKGISADEFLPDGIVAVYSLFYSQQSGGLVPTSANLGNTGGEGQGPWPRSAADHFDLGSNDLGRMRETAVQVATGIRPDFTQFVQSFRDFGFSGVNHCDGQAVPSHGAH